MTEIAEGVKGSRLARRLGILAGAFLLVLLVGVLVLKMIFTREKLRALVEPRIEAATSRDVTLESVRLKVFPRLAIRLSGMQVANGPSFGPEPMLALDALDIRVRFWPLLRRRVELAGVRLIGPRIRYEVAADGTTNVDGLGSAESTPERDDADASRGRGALALFVSDLRLEGGSVYYDDARTGRRAELGLEGRLSAHTESASAPLDASLRFDLADVRVRRSAEPGDSLAVFSASAELDLFADLVGDSLAVTRGGLELAGLPLEASGAVRHLKGDRVLDLSLESGTVQIASLLEQLPPERRAELDVGGTIQVSVHISGPLRRREELRLNGPVHLRDVGYRREKAPQPIRIESGTVQLTGTGIAIEKMPISIGSSDLELSLTGRDFLRPALAGERRTRVEFNLTSNRLAVADLATESDEPGYAQLVTARLAGARIDGREPGEVAQERLKLPPIPFDARGRVTIGDLINPPNDARDVSLDVLLRDGVLTLSNLRGSMYGGQARGSLRFDARDAAPPYELTYVLSLANARAEAFVSRWTRLGKALTGTMNFDISGNAQLDASLLPVADAVNADGSTTFNDGEFIDFGPAEALVQRFKLDERVSRAYRNLGGPFKIEDGAFIVEKWSMSAGDLTGSVDGRASLGGGLDLGLELAVPASALERAGLTGGGIESLLGLLSGDSGDIPVSLRVGGTIRQPSVRLDSEALEAALRKKGEEEGKNLLERLIRPPDKP